MNNGVILECYECKLETDTCIGSNWPLAEGHIQWFGHGTAGLHDQDVGGNNENILLNQTCNTKVYKCNVFII